MLQKEMAAALPNAPGVYFFRDGQDKLLYVGKAKSLRKRVLSYTYASKRRPRRTQELIKRTESLDYDTCGSELEALILESRLIKEWQPSFNRALKRFRRFRFLRIDVSQPFPLVTVVAEIEGDSARYFGPFHHFDAAQTALEVLHKLFPLRTCEGRIVPRPSARPCFEHHLERCGAPCAGRVSPEEYSTLIEDVECFLRGEYDPFLERLAVRRDEAAQALLFEKAAYLHRRILQIQHVLDRHRFCVNSVDHNDVAVVGILDGQEQTVLLIRNGRLASHEQIHGGPKTRRRKLLRSVTRIYERDDPPTECTPYDVDAMNIISNWLYHHRDEQSIVRFDADLEPFVEAILGAADQLRIAQAAAEVST